MGGRAEVLFVGFDAADPDVHWNHSVPVRPVSSPTFGEAHWHDTDHRIGNHRPRGLLIAAGSPGSQPPPRWTAATIDVTDIAPRVASFVGVDLPRR